MRYECAAGHCWLDEHVARLGEFDECFPGRIGFTDVDGLVERNGHALVIELKCSDRGGLRMAENLPRESLYGRSALR